MALFQMSEVLQIKDRDSLLPKCGSCGLYKHCISPKMKPSGRGSKRILILAESPGENEDRRGVQLIGNSGRKLEETLAKFGVDMRRDCLLTNSLICRPKDGIIKDSRAIDWCRPNLIKTLNEFKPEIIIPLGSVAIRSLFPYIWKEKPGGIKRWAGFQIPNQKLNAWVCPTFHPSFLLHSKEKVLEVLFERHLKQAVAKQDRPWEEIPDYKSMVERIHDDQKAAKILRQMIKRGGAISFDYETNMIKPDSDKSRIVCCSVCWDGKKTIAYPWYGEAIVATRELLRSPLPKYGYSIKFEERWTRAKLKTSVRNWQHDGMLAAHILDNRPGVSGLKFQAMALLGVDSYDDHIKPYLQSKKKGGYEENRIDEVNLDDLLLYNGLDSLLEFLVAKKQIELLCSLKS